MKIGSLLEMGMNFEFRVQKAHPAPAPAPPKTAVLKSVRIMPIAKFVVRERRRERQRGAKC